jgi:predicted transcriptional regulator
MLFMNLYKELSPSAFMMLTFFIFSANKKNEVSISLRGIENLVNLSRVTVSNALNELETKGFIQKINYQKEVSQHTPNSYTLQFDKRIIAETGW